MSTLADFKDLYGVEVYGFCLMTNHVHLIAKPGEAIAGMGLPKRLGKFDLQVAPEKTQCLRFSRFHPSMKRALHLSRLRAVLVRRPQRNSAGHAPHRTQEASKRVPANQGMNRHLRSRDFVKGLNRRLVGHYNYYGLRGNSRALWRFYQRAIECAFKWLNRRGGKRNGFSWGTFSRALKQLAVAKPRITEQPHARRVFA